MKLKPPLIPGSPPMKVLQTCTTIVKVQQQLLLSQDHSPMTRKARQKFAGSPSRFLMDLCPSPTLVKRVAFPPERNGN